ncbi:MAG: hypothetical protein COB38_08500 [Gammaproteobacteria bacterium]|nr:MAG: hypothetical protein COB38_08500 [Gammaproteobacteria bacterium]
MFIRYPELKYIVLFSGLLTPFVYAAESDVTGADAEEEVSNIIIVTAQKREQDIKDVPISMSVLTSDILDKSGAQSLLEMQKIVPNFSFDSVNGFDNISVRGVGGGGRNIGFDPRAGLYIDGVYIGQAAALSAPLFDMERVEVLRGPQGHLFGRNTVSGAVSLVTKDPSESFAGFVKVVAGSENNREIHAGVEGSLSDTITAKVSTAFQTRDGFVKNIFDDSDLDDVKRKVIRSKIIYAPSDILAIDFSFDYAKTDFKSLVGEPVSQNHPALGPLLTPFISEPPRSVNFNQTPGSFHDLGGASITVDYELSGGNIVTAISGYRTSEQARSNDTDYSPIDLISIDYTDESKQFSQELRIASPGDQDTRYVVGLYYLTDEAKTERIANASAALIGVPGYNENNDSAVDTTSTALFAAIDIDLSESLTLNLGMRYTDETKDLNYRLVNSFGLEPIGAFGLIHEPGYVDSRNESHFKPTVGFTYAINDDLNVYTKYATGFKSGGFNVDFLGEAAFSEIEFDTEDVESYEFGIKGRTAKGVVNYDLAIFQSIYTDFQILQFVEVAPSVFLPVLRNAAEVETTGLEASTSVYVTNDFRIGANVGILDAEFTSFPNGNALGQDLAGNELPNAPKLTGAITMDYYYPMDSLGGGVDFYFEYSFRDKSFADAENLPKRELGERNLVTARITFTPDDDSWSVSIWGNNLFNDTYIDIAGTDFLATDFVRYGAPRTVGIDLTFNFE